MRRLVLVVSALVCAAAPAAAAQRVVFEDGRTLRAESAVSDAEVTVLVLEGGGTLTIPTARIVAVEPLAEVAEPEVPAEAAPGVVAGLAEALRAGERWRVMAGPWADAIAGTAARHGLDPALLAAMVRVESNFETRAVSPKGACGLLQLMPDTARRFGVRDVFDPAQNLDAGARYFRWLLDRYRGRTDLALAGYNAGEGAVDRHGRRIPPYGETLRYVNRILEQALRDRAAAPSLAASGDGGVDEAR